MSREIVIIDSICLLDTRNVGERRIIGVRQGKRFKIQKKGRRKRRKKSLSRTRKAFGLGAIRM
jgi:hypothetical protein